MLGYLNFKQSLKCYLGKYKCFHFKTHSFEDSDFMRYSFFKIYHKNDKKNHVLQILFCLEQSTIFFFLIKYVIIQNF